MIFETENLLIRKLLKTDIATFYQMQKNINVMQFTTGKVKDFEGNKKELYDVILKYNLPNNNFWIYAIEEKKHQKFVGTCALVKDKNNDDEIGYRFLESEWGKGYGTELCRGLLNYCKTIGIKKLTAYVVDKNSASKKIIEKNGFKFVKKQLAEDLNLPETKYELYL